jgi:hypothetical protein
MSLRRRRSDGDTLTVPGDDSRASRTTWQKMRWSASGFCREFSLGEKTLKKRKRRIIKSYVNK